MPTVHKRPMYPHKGNQWSWTHYDSFCRSNTGFSEFGVLLKQLCVVDVDDFGVADELEERFPYLKWVPTEQTRKGRHYWFIRSTFADAGHFYDGASQVSERIDFKSISPDGTSGFVVVAPSYGKMWLRHLARSEYAPAADLTDPAVIRSRKFIMAPIPDDLLRSVARSRIEACIPHTKMTTAEWSGGNDHVMLVFDDSTSIMMKDIIKSPHVLQKMAYFDIMSLLSFPISETHMRVNVPCRKEDFQTIYDFCVFKELVWIQSSHGLQDVVDTADRLGLRMDVFQKLRYAVAEIQDVGCVCPELLNGLMRERIGRRDSASYKLVDVFDIPPHGDVVHKEEEDGLWFKDDGEHVWLFDGLDVPALRICPNMRLLPSEVDLILFMYPGKLVLAGGSALSIAVDGVGSGSDFDLFLVDVDAEEACEILSEIERSFSQRPECTVLLTRHAMTILFDDHSEPLQIILRLHSSVAGVLLGFDIAPARVGIGYDSVGVLRMWCTHTWVTSVQQRMFVLESVFWGRGSVARIIKYVGKGFNCLVPVGRSQHMLKIDYGTHMMQYGRLSGLFAAEKYLSTRRLRSANVASYKQKRVDDDTTSTGTTTTPWWWSLLGCGCDVGDDKPHTMMCGTLRGIMHAPLSPRECKLIYFSVSIHSDYDLAAKVTRKLRYVVRGIRDALLRLGLSLGYFHENKYRGLNHLTVGSSESLMTSANAKRYTFMKTSALGMFYPIDICFEEVYDLE